MGTSPREHPKEHRHAGHSADKSFVIVLVPGLSFRMFANDCGPLSELEGADSPKVPELLPWNSDVGAVLDINPRTPKRLE